uniref:Putative kDa family member n=1 Tax=Rhipicephalus microplus TaxID=6941 RepID=A0A6G5A546_RHIMP
MAFFCSLAYVIPNKSIAYEGSGNASCIYNGTEWKHNDYNLSSDPCVFLWCRNGNMTIEGCDPPIPTNSGYGNCKYVSLGGPFPDCCRYTRIC